jgi:hypothetical protein
MTRYSLWAILFGTLTHLYSSSAACAEPGDSEPPPSSSEMPANAASQTRIAPCDSGEHRKIKATLIPPQRAWYGGTILGVDALAASLMAVGVASSSGGLFLGSGVAFTLGGPIVHGIHRDGGKAVVSLGLRVGLPVVGGLVGVFAGASGGEDCEGDMCQLSGVAAGGAVGLGLGMVAASALDVTFLAYDSPPPSTNTQVALVPAIDPTKRSGSLTLQGTW